MADIPNQLRAIKVNGSKFEKDLALLDAADTIAAQSARIEELEKQIIQATALLQNERYWAENGMIVKRSDLETLLNILSGEGKPSRLFDRISDLVKQVEALNGGSDNG